MRIHIGVRVLYPRVSLLAQCIGRRGTQLYGITNLQSELFRVLERSRRVSYIP